MGNGSWMVSLLLFVNYWDSVSFYSDRGFLSNGLCAVFHVTDQHGNKLSEVDVAEKIQQVILQKQKPNQTMDFWLKILLKMWYFEIT